MPDGSTPSSLRTAAADFDRDDPTGPLGGRFVVPDPDVSYLDGNSLGRPTVAAAAAAADVLDRWGAELVGGWDTWIDRSLAVGDRLAPVLGVGTGRVLVDGTTTLALHQAASAALDARPGRRVVVAGRTDFPTDRYVAAGVAAAHGATVRWVAHHDTQALVDAVDDDVAVVVSSVASFETAALVDVGAVTAAAHRVGALTVWDGSHAAGAVPLDLDAAGFDVAVGCTYKYLHGGPGAPAWIAIGEHADGLRQPVHGWFGQRDQFAMGMDYDPVPGVAGWRTGTPSMLALEVAATGIDVVADAGIDVARTKSLALSTFLVEAAEEWLVPHGGSLAGPQDPAARGGHLAVRHPEASRVVRAGRRLGVVADFRGPDLIRLGPGPLAASATEVVDGVARLGHVLAEGLHLAEPPDPGRVT